MTSLPAERDEPVTAAGREFEARFNDPTTRPRHLHDVRPAVLAIEREASTPSVEALAVLDNLLRHHNTLHSSDCEFARAALAHLSPPTDTGAER